MRCKCLIVSMWLPNNLEISYRSYLHVSAVTTDSRHSLWWYKCEKEIYSEGGPLVDKLLDATKSNFLTPNGFEFFKE